MLSNEEIEYFKNNQNLITPELLEGLRALGKEGKQQALDILDMPKDEENYYLDAFGNRISFNGNRGLKKEHIKLKLYDIHYSEIERCARSVHYFLSNYVKMTTPKDGFNFVDLREYQHEFLDLLDNDELESIVSMQPRQCVDGDVELTINNQKILAKDFFEVIKNGKEQKGS